MAEPDLKSLIEAVARGERDAFGLLYDATSSKLFGVAIRILKRSDLAEDVVQDTYLKIWDNAAGYRPGLGSPLGWMVTITRNRAIDVLRKRSESQLNDQNGDEPEDTALPDPFHLASRNSELRAFLACLKQLDPKQQESLLMAYYHGYTHEEIASRFASPVGTVKSWIRRGLARVRECLSDA